MLELVLQALHQEDTTAHAPNSLHIMNYRVTGVRQICQKLLLSISWIKLLFLFPWSFMLSWRPVSFSAPAQAALKSCEADTSSLLFVLKRLKPVTEDDEFDGISTARCGCVTGLFYRDITCFGYLDTDRSDDRPHRWRWWHPRWLFLNAVTTSLACWLDFWRREFTVDILGHPVILSYFI